MLRILATLAALACLPAAVLAQIADYPARPLTLMVGFAPGGPNDIQGRLIARALAARLGQPVEVINRPGESGNLATLSVAGAAPDGYTLLLIGPANAINASLFAGLPFDLRRDIVPVAGITREALVLVVHPAVPATSVAEFLAYASRDGAKPTIASTGNGSAPHVAALLFNRLAGLDLPILHFSGGGPALKDLVAGGRTQLMFEPMSASIGPVKAGLLRALAVTTVAPSSALRGVPTLAASLPGFEASAVTGIGVPRGTPQAIVDRLNREVNAALADPAVRPQFAESGGEPLAGSPATFAQLVFGEIEKWATVLAAAGIKPQ
jgi:tripartite-type tricarboxylate transporter receptor subunit TctC